MFSKQDQIQGYDDALLAAMKYMRKLLQTRPLQLLCGYDFFAFVFAYYNFFEALNLNDFIR